MFGLFSLLVTASSLLSSSNSGSIDPGFYIVHSDVVSGFVQVTFQEESFLYWNDGALFAKPISVRLESSIEGFEMSRSGGRNSNTRLNPNIEKALDRLTGGRKSTNRSEVPLEKEGSKTVMRLADGRHYDVQLEPYQVPEFYRPRGSRPFCSSRYRVKEEHNKVYGHALGFWNNYPDRNESALIVFGRKTFECFSSRKDVNLAMDIYSPANDNATVRPLLLLIHGGAFFNGDKEVEAMVLWAKHFASLGYVVASINYRLGFRPTCNEVERAGYRAVQDANAAVRYLLERKDLAIDPRLVFVAGTSAGAITALNLAYMQEKDRPAITRGGLLGDEGKIDSINPESKNEFVVRAVGNMWGAVADTSILYNARIPVISFHSERDPIVPYKSDHPFGSMFHFVEIPLIHSLIETAITTFLPIDGPLQLGGINEWLFPMMHGSYVIDRVLRNRGIRTELHSSLDSRHSLHQDERGRIIQSVFTEIQDGMESFFSKEMTPSPVFLCQDRIDSQVFRIDASDVAECYWKVDNGIILWKNDNSIRVLMMAGFSPHSVTVSGTYRWSGLAFCETIDLD